MCPQNKPMQAGDLFDWPESMPFADFFSTTARPWEWLEQIALALAAFDFAATALPQFPAGVEVCGPVYIDPSVRLPAYCTLHGPAWIGSEVQIRPGAFIRGNVIVGARSVLGNACEYKNCLLLEGVETPHYNYVGDSVLGNKAHLGAGAICANLRLDRRPVTVRTGNGDYPTGLRKVGAFIGDGAEAACNTVLQPGTILGRGSAVMATAFGGHLPAGKMAVAKTAVRVLDRP
jgi:NDP-sugar pyrophosphorylase family protein